MIVSGGAGCGDACLGFELVAEVWPAVSGGKIPLFAFADPIARRLSRRFGAGRPLRAVGTSGHGGGVSACGSLPRRTRLPCCLGAHRACCHEPGACSNASVAREHGVRREIRGSLEVFGWACAGAGYFDGAVRERCSLAGGFLRLEATKRDKADACRTPSTIRLSLVLVLPG